MIAAGEPEDGKRRQRQSNALTMRDVRASASEVGKIPACKDPARHAKCEFDLHLFLITYFPQTAGLAPYGPAQLRAIEHLQQAILATGCDLSLLPRGYCKSTISELACIWAALYGHRRFILFLGANESAARDGIDSIKSELENNELLEADFPEIVLPIRKLEGKHQRASSQLHNGKLTGIEWTSSRIVLPFIEGAKGAGCIISSDGLLSAKRGARYKRPDGKYVRPSMIVLDDPQTDASAVSQPEIEKRLNIITKSIMHLGGHGSRVSVVINATTIAPDDLTCRLADKAKFPMWTVIRAASVEKMPTALETHWLKEYARLLKDFSAEDITGQRNALGRATAYYEANREIMDEDAEVSWPDIPLEPGEISALQHSLNVLILEGAEVFDSELQNRPKVQIVDESLQVPKTVGSRVNGLAVGAIPEDAPFLVFFIDLHDHIHYYSIAAVTQDFVGSIIEYGTWPRQPTAYFSHNAPKKRLSDLYKRESTDSCIKKGLVELLQYLGKKGTISCGLVDAGYKPAIALQAIKEAKIANVYCSKGLPIGPAEKPLQEYDLSQKRVRKYGPSRNNVLWYSPTDQELRIHFDANLIKSIAAERLNGTAAPWKLYGSESTNHELYAHHLQSEYPTLISAKGRSVNMWKLRPSAQNHYWDTFVGCNTAAIIAGCRLPGMEEAKPKVVKRPQRRYGATPIDI